MHTNTYLLHGLKYASLTLAIAVGAIVAAALMRSANPGSLTGRLVPVAERQGDIPTVHFDQKRVKEGFTVPKDVHVIFDLPAGAPIARVTFFGGPDLDQTVPYWGYCYSGREARNRADGRQGDQLYDGLYFYSRAEINAQSGTPAPPADSDLIGILQSLHNAAPPPPPKSIAEMLYGGKTCYVMTSRELPAGPDSDSDDVNDKREQLVGTNPNIPDTDSDGIPDGREIFVTHTNPLAADTDQDGLGDRCEDKNANGIIDAGETSPWNADSDRDGLCDGNGMSPGCPEPRENVCEIAASGDRVCRTQLKSLVYGEDMNHNCIVDDGETDPTNMYTFGSPDDWDWKWEQFKDKPAAGTPAPAFPIPSLPGSNR